ncbi:hypothetical protein DYU05_09485 [Mucilaginibacter terrenus]|uniref:Uncharacterized protein n=1 Tax=Mucilaginibacter terrenus TaxID=2482727 RepID=A0A3E2NXQ7_9SPHI|nr:hypothetical protein [Mucilaginibacter terrenus]RFZ85805.1 hypothetical protein DYU05_09485 [Mucilaginibacter terrenus]
MRYTNFLYNFIAVAAICLVLNSCGGDKKKGNKIYTSIETDESVKPTFKPVWGIKYTEVRRNFQNGVSFNDDGYQLEPEWKFSFVSDDTVNIYHPRRSRFVNAPVMFDHDSLFNIAWAWVRLRKLSKDSIVFQVMKVEGKELMRDKSVVYMTMYANDYIKNVLHTDTSHAKRPTRADTLFIKHKTELALRDTDKAFAARDIAVLTSKSKNLTIERVNNIKDDEEQEGLIQDYMLPEYNIRIKNAYDDFKYAFSVRIDEKGTLHYLRSVNYIFPEFLKSSNKAMKGIVDGYLKAYLDVKPGTTLGIPHPCFIIVNVNGTKKK